MKRYRYFMMLLLFAVLMLVPLQQTNAQSADEAYTSATRYMLERVPNPTYGDEWVIIALARGEAAVPANYFEVYYKNLVKEVQALKGNLHNYKYTEYSRVIIALAAIGKDATNVGGYNLTTALENVENVVWQGVNGSTFALIALDTWQYEAAGRTALLEDLLANQLADGGFSLGGDEADLDVTAMAIQAMAPYANEARVAAALARAVAKMNALASAQSISSAETAAQVVTAYAALQLDATPYVQQLLTFYNEADGGFKHVLDEEQANGMATEQASYALAAYNRYLQEKTSLYTMTDTRGSFIDTNSSWAKDYIEEAVALGLLKGYPNNKFQPNQSLTRAQAISIIVRALKLTNEADAPFTDLGNMAAATKNEIAAAYEAGLLKYNDGRFRPYAPITRLQLGLMLMRAYNVQHEAFRANTTVSYRDTAHLGAEEQLALAFLAHYEIATGSNGKFQPYKATTRAQMAKMSVQFVKEAMQR